MDMHKDMNGKELLSYFKTNTEANGVLYKYTYFLNSESKISERIYCYINKIKECLKCSCGKTLKFHKMNKGYFKTCGDLECINKKRSDSIDRTMVEKYGEHSSKRKDVKEKTKKTLLTKYGKENYVNIQAQKETMLEKYGVEHALQSEHIKNKRSATILEKYGSTNFYNIEKARDTCNNKYGTDNPMQNTEISSKSRVTFIKNHLYLLNKKVSDLSLTVIKSFSNYYEVICSTCNNKFEISNTTFNVNIRAGVTPCRVCNPLKSDYRSKGENQIYEFVKSIYTGDVIKNYMRGTKNEIDIYIPELKLGFEYNGLYYHNELFKESNYHLGKKERLNLLDIDLIHIFEDDWLHKKTIVESRIENLLNLSKRIYARKCHVINVSSADARSFLSDNHIQGSINSSIRLGLMYDGVLMSLMTFGKKRAIYGGSSDTGSYELLRFASMKGTNVVGGASKLFKAFLKLEKPLEVFSYSNKCWSTNKTSVYEKMGFVRTSESVPNYWYVLRDTRYHRYGFRKDVLVKQGFSKDMSAHEIMLQRKIYRIYDCGTTKYIFNNK
jgi:hypothetical protein